MTEIYKKIRSELFQNGADTDLDTALRIMQLERMDNLAEQLDRIATALENIDASADGIDNLMRSCTMPVHGATAVIVNGQITTR